MKTQKRKDLETVHREKSTEDAFFETSAQDYDIILFIHGEMMG